MLSKISIIDNSGGVKGRVIRLLKKKSKLDVGCLVLISILYNISNSKIRKGQLYKGIMVKDNTINYGYNFLSKKSLVLVKTKNIDLLPIASRIKSFISIKIKNVKGSNRIVSMSKRII